MQRAAALALLLTTLAPAAVADAAGTFKPRLRTRTATAACEENHCDGCLVMAMDVDEHACAHIGGEPHCCAAEEFIVNCLDSRTVCDFKDEDEEGEWFEALAKELDEDANRKSKEANAAAEPGLAAE